MSLKDLIARKAAALLEPGWVVNLGIGIPTLVSKYIDQGTIFLQTENGLLGMGPPPGEGRIDPNLVNAGKQPVTELPGASYFSSADSFAMIRGGHVDAAVLGALQVDERGRVANWNIPGQPVLGVGGAMDLLVGARVVIITMTHTARDGSPKIVKKCTLPLTSLRPVNWIVTELATFKVEGERLMLVEISPGVTMDEVREKTEGFFDVDIKMPLGRIDPYRR